MSSTYQMGKYEVTVAQYCQFLNAVARTDTYGLYNPAMATGNVACGIIQEGSNGNYAYSAVPGPEDFPVNWVSWGDAVRFANWLNHGQPIGAQGAATTEAGSYALDGANSRDALMAVTRNVTTARYVIPTQDE